MARTPTTDKYNYVLDWIRESNEARRAQNALVERTVKAYQGEPYVNYYKKSIIAFGTSLKTSDPDHSRMILDIAKEIPDKGSTVVEDAVEAVVSMTMGGVGRFEFGPYDPDLAKDDDIIDKLASAAKHFYTMNKIDSIVPQYIRDAVLAGSSTIILRKVDKKTHTILLGSDQMLFDPKRVKTNCERFIGFSQRESWDAVKKRTTKTKSGYIMSSINEADVYVAEIRMQINGLLTDANPSKTFLHDELRQDLNTFYNPVWLRYGGATPSTVDPNNPATMYSGDEVEMTYLYDKKFDMYFEIVNRRYITVGKANPLKRSITCEFLDADGKTHKITKEIKLDDPFIELPYRKTIWDTFPVSPLFRRLDDFDSVCSMESLLYHNVSVSAALNFVGQSSDNQKVARAAGIAGEMIEGLPQTFGVLNKNHDDTNLLGLITRYEARIKRSINATDPFQMQAMIGDRASAKEVIAAQGQVSQGLNPFIANIETAMATMGDKFIKLELIMNEDAYPFVHNGEYAELSPQDMAGDYEVSAKLTSSILMEQEAAAAKAIQIMQYLGNTEGLDKKQFLGTMIPIALGSLVSRAQAESMVLPQYRILPPHPINDDKDAEPISQAELDAMSPEQLDALIKEATRVHADNSAYFDPSMQQDPNNPGVPGGSVLSVDPAQAAVAAQSQQAAQPPAGDPAMDPAAQGLPPTNGQPQVDPTTGVPIG